MCGVAGIAGSSTRDHREILSNMLDRMIHRGPDDRGCWTDEGIALGHVRLSIIDPSTRGHQPFLTADGLGVLSYNGEVYNFRDIRADLEREGVTFRSDTDTEVVLHALINLLLYERLEGRMTPYRNVEAVMPGTLCRISSTGERHVTTYFDVLRDLDPSRILGAEASSFSTLTDRCRDLLRGSVQRHLVSDAPLATMCSGGLDSGLITAFARETHPDLVSYVADIEGMNGEEVRRASTVCDALKVDLRVVDVSAEKYFRMLPIALQANDQPLYFPQKVASLIVAETLHRDGFKVVLTGDGADELFGGYEQHAGAHRAWRRRRLHAAWIPDNRLSRLLGKLHPRLKPLDLNKLARAPLQPAQPARPRVKELNVTLVDGARRHLRPARLFEKLAPLPRHEDRAFLTSSFEDVYVHMRESLKSADCMAMHHSVENRVPFLDNQLIDFALHLPVSAKYAGGISKRIIRQLAGQYLPREVIDLPKIGFGIKPSLWKGLAPMLHNGRVADLLKWDAADQRDIQALLPQEPFSLIRVLGMELWLALTFDGQKPEQLSEELLRVKHAHTANGSAVRA